MVKVPTYSFTGEKTGDIEVDLSVFGDKILPKTMHQMVVGYFAHKRVGTHSTKTRGEVAGTNAKMYRQKGTGRARAGRRSSGVRVGGGIIFGPKPRTYDNTLPKKMRRVALDSALLSKFLDNEVLILDSIPSDAPKTRPVAKFLEAVGIGEKKSCLFGLAEHNDNIYLSIRNIAKAQVNEVRNFNALDVLRNVRLVLTKDALQKLIESREEAARARKAKAAAKAEAGD